MAETKGKAGETATSNTSASQNDALAAQLAPVNEFRERADSWMKEITAQVARLAGRSEDEERRKKAMDQRLSDIESRMQSLLTLTEMVSQSKNPFAGPGRAASAPATPAGDAPPQTQAPPAAARNETELPPKAGATSEAADAAPSTPASAPDQQARAEPRSVPVEGPPQAPAIRDPPAPSRPARGHPNDARAETHAPAVPDERRFVADTFPSPTARAPAKQGGGRPDARYFVLEWARVLAPSAHRIDLGAFLGFYVESGWVDAPTIAAVRNLTLQLMKDDHPDNASMTLEELHARSILLVSRLEGIRQAPAEARAVLHDAREAACGDWAVLAR